MPKTKLKMIGKSCQIIIKKVSKMWILFIIYIEKCKYYTD